MNRILSKLVGARTASSAFPSKLGLLLLGLCLLTACGTTRRAGTPPINVERDTILINSLLNAQVQAWNEGNIEKFMGAYVDSDRLRFASGGEVEQGFAATLNRYKRRYPNKAAMGELTFGEIDVTIMAHDAAYVFGRWRLERAQDAPMGLFTLVLAKTPAGWRIVHDHTSAGNSK